MSGSLTVQTTGKAFGSSSLNSHCTNTGAGKAPRTASGIHCWDNLNDGRYGNSYSWIPNVNGAKAGVVLPAPRTIVGIQLARDLGGESYRYTDRAGGTITVEYSATANSDANPWSSTGWVAAGSISGWAANTRNYYQFSTPVVADGLRITVSSGDSCIDELEIYATGITAPPPPVYSFIYSGDCPSNGLKYIITYEECGRAGETLGIASVNAAWYANRGYPGGNRQKYCGTFADKSYLHFNSQTSGTIGGYRIIQKAGMHSWGGADKIWQVCKS